MTGLTRDIHGIPAADNVCQPLTLVVYTTTMYGSYAEGSKLKRKRKEIRQFLLKDLTRWKREGGGVGWVEDIQRMR